MSLPSVQAQCLWTNCFMVPPFCWEGSAFSALFLMFAHERAEMDFSGLFYFARDLVFCFHRTSLPFLDRVKFCKSGWNYSFSSCFQVCQTLSFEYFFARYLPYDGMILSWGLLCAGHFIIFLNRSLDKGSRLMKQILGVSWECSIDDSCFLIWLWAKCVLHQSLNTVCFRAAELTCSCYVLSDETTTSKSLTNSVTPIFFLAINNPLVCRFP